MRSLVAADFHLTQYQASLVTPEADLSVRAILRDLYPRWAERFDAEPAVLPRTSGTSPDTPLILLASQNGEWSCDIAPTRINVQWRRVTLVGEQPDEAALLEHLARMVIQYAGATGARIGRLGAIAARIAPHASPALFLTRHFFREHEDGGALDRPENVELNVHKRLAIGSFLVNSWDRFRTGAFSTGAAATSPAVFVEQDINTLAEQAASQSYTAAEIADFYKRAASQMSPQLEQLFPGPKSP